MKRLHLTMWGLLLIRSEPITKEAADIRAGNWLRVFGDTAVIEYR